MFRTTFVTGYAFFGTQVRQVTAHLNSITNEVEFRTKGGQVAPVTLDTTWKTLRGGRNTVAAKIHDDGRFSKDGPSMFAFTTNHITNKKGKVMGRLEKTPDFIAHMLAVSGEGEWRGETKADREHDAFLIIQALSVQS